MDKRSLIFIILLSIGFFVLQEFFFPKKTTTVKPKVVQEEKAKPSSAPVEEEDFVVEKKQTHYVLENDYMQVVFSTLGGAVTEINLPFHSTSDQKSPILPIEPDKIIVEQNPANARFPLTPYYTVKTKGGSSQWVDEGQLGGYYPLLRRGIVRNGKLVKAPTPDNYAFNLVSDEPSIENSYYKMSHIDHDSITFVGKHKGATITKTFKLTNDGSVPYCLNLDLDISNNTEPLWLSSGVLEIELMPSHDFQLRYREESNNKYSINKLSLPKSAQAYDDISIDWLASTNGFFGLIIDPLDTPPSKMNSKLVPGVQLPTRYTLVNSQSDEYPAKKYPGYELFVSVSKNGTSSYRIFAGPSQTSLIKALDKKFSDPLKNYDPDYAGAFATKGFFSFITAPFAKLLYWLMSFFHLISRSWGISIILLTIALRIMLYPLNSWSIKSNMRMQKLAPELKALQKRYQHDHKKLQMETIKLYKEMKANPFTGCLPVLIQMPFLFGMFILLRTTFDLRGVGFIPGWIDNLTSPDVLFSWGHSIIFFGNSFHLLPILVGVAMFLQQKVSSPFSKDKGSELTDQQKQQRMMMYVMPIVFTFITYNLASGLNIYWFSSTVLAILQQMLMAKKKKAAEVALTEKK